MKKRTFIIKDRIAHFVGNDHLDINIPGYQTFYANTNWTVPFMLRHMVDTVILSNPEDNPYIKGYFIEPEPAICCDACAIAGISNFVNNMVDLFKQCASNEYLFKMNVQQMNLGINTDLIYSIVIRRIALDRAQDELG